MALFLALIAASPSLVEGLRELQFDGYQRLFTRERRTAPAVIVAIDERALHELGQWPWPRTQMAKLVSRIAEARPAAIGLDVLFPEPDRYSPRHIARAMTEFPADLVARLLDLPDNDERFAGAVKDGKAILAMAGLEQPDARFPGPPQAAPARFMQTGELRLRSFAGRLASVETIDRAAAGRGLISVEASDRVVRRVPLLAEVSGVVVPALSLEMWRLATGAPTIDVAGRPDGLIEHRLQGLSSVPREVAAMTEEIAWGGRMAELASECPRRRPALAAEPFVLLGGSESPPRQTRSLVSWVIAPVSRA